MKIDILTLFPKMFTGPFDESIVARAQEKGLVKIEVHNLRRWTKDIHKTVDGKPFGGGPGMVLRVDVIDKAIADLRKGKGENAKVIILSPKGETYSQKQALHLSKANHLILIAGHYEGVDHRVFEHIADEIISIGNYILTGGEIPAMAIVDSIVRLIPEAIDPESLKNESFSLTTENRSPARRSYASPQLLQRCRRASGVAGGPKTDFEHPQYTRPADYKGWKVPEVLLSGNHKEIEKWREEN